MTNNKSKLEISLISLGDFCWLNLFFSSSGRPGPPSAPIKFEEIGSEKITLSWLPPKDDGGSKVTNYVIWRRVANRKTWVPVTNEPKERIWTVENLMQGHEYVFRIMAQNKYGVGEPLDSEPEVARDLFSESKIKIFIFRVAL